MTLAVSGKLWNRSLVMVDSETESLWSHILGEAMAGPLEGAELPLLPGLMTDWKTWRTRHPETTVVTLSRTSGNYLTQFYADPARFVIGVASGKDSKYWPFDELQKSQVVNDTFPENRPVVVLFDAATSTAFLYERRLDKETLEFEAAEDGKVVDTATRSLWVPATGHCVSGDLKGKSLRLIPGIISFRNTWQAFHGGS